MRIRKMRHLRPHVEEIGSLGLLDVCVGVVLFGLDLLYHPFNRAVVRFQKLVDARPESLRLGD